MRQLLAGLPRRTLGEIMLGGFTLELLTLAIPLFSQAVIDKVAVHNSLDTLTILALGVLLVVVFEATLGYVYCRHIYWFSAAVDAAITRPLLTHLVRLPLSFFEARAKGEIAAHIRQIASIREHLSLAAVNTLIDFVFMFFVLALIALYSGTLALLVLSCVPVLAVSGAVLRPVVLAAYRRRERKSDLFESRLAEGLQAIGTIKSMALEDAWLKRCLEAYDRFNAADHAAKKTEAVEGTVARVVQRLLVLSVLWVGTTQVLFGGLSLGQLMACYMFSQRVLTPSSRLFHLVIGLSRTRQAREQLEALLAVPQEPDVRRQLPAGAVAASRALQVDQVSFRYAAGHAPVLDRVSLEVTAGSFIGIMGHSGSGKSTLVKLMQRHLDPHGGTLHWGGIDLRDQDLRALRRDICLVTHDALLFEGTVQENICGFAPQPDPQRARLCSEVAQAHGFVQQLPLGYDTHLDERAMNLSSGQRQRIALARALYSQASVLILDEATNALDAETETAAIRAIRRHFAACALVVVTHRDPVLREADHVFTLLDGKLAPGRLAAPHFELAAPVCA